MGALRIHFTADDLARTRLTTAPSPMIEMTMSLRAIRGLTPGSHRLANWRRALRGRFDQRVRPLMEFVPYGWVLPDFLDPRTIEGSGEQRLAQVVSTTTPTIRGYLNDIGTYYDVPSATARYADEGSAGLRDLSSAVTAYFDTAIGPYWNDVRSLVDGDLAVRHRVLADGGLDRLLNTLHHQISWREPVLRVGLSTTYEADVHLGGRGLHLQPSVFTGAQPALWHHDRRDGPPTLVYPATTDGRPAVLRGQNSLAALLGRTRAYLLAAIAASPGSLTGELARGLRISAASASEHATVLRNAGLITTIRYGRTALHTVTPLGEAMLRPSTPLTEPPHPAM
ncbi:winged helix-turn-helix domain-containing protein [Hamadaea tsunoensis]|uniref:winged helix-turn-helix domain-containing protein n=1 Tax=Hamadaea tsunoensis TaxID=53368 RepID=UPI000684DC53|nr:winged helix-turn-helix domain-containing protein [Hamadaea tsunoensis]